MIVYIVMIHDGEERPYVDRVFFNRDEAEAYCEFFNTKGTHEGYADFISEYVIGTRLTETEEL